MLALFFLIFNCIVFLLSNYLLDGVTKNFFQKLMPISLMLCFFSFIYEITFRFFIKFKIISFIKIKIIDKLPLKKLSYTASDDFYFLIPLIIILNYYIFNLINKEITINSFYSEFVILLFLLLFFLLILNFLIRGRLLKFCLKFNLLIFLIYIAAFPILSSVFGWSDQASLKIGLPLFLFLIIFLFILFLYQKLLLRVFSIIFTLSIIINLFLINFTKPSYKIDNSLEQALINKKLKTTPNIYLLTYDSYVTNEVMSLYNIDNSKQEQFLKEEGFIFYPKTYSISTQSVFSMGRMIDLKKGEEHKAVAGQNLTTKILKNNGYKTYGIFKNRYFFTSQNNKDYYDKSFPKVVTSGLYKAIMAGKFSWNTVVWNIDEIQSEERFFLQKKSELLTKKFKAPIFLYSHTGPSHSPKNGTCNSKKEIKDYKKRLYLANIEMKRDVKNIKKSNPNSIIIINGDHGPFLLNKCGKFESLSLSGKVDKSFLKDNFGSFLAISWPDDYENQFPDTKITILQDTFFEIFEYLFQSEKIYNYNIKPTTDLKESGKIIAGGVFVDNNRIVGGRNNGERLYNKNP